MCMTFEALGVSEVRSPLMLMYPFTDAATLGKGFGSLVTDGADNMALSGVGGSFVSGGGVILKAGEYLTSPWIDFGAFNEFTMTFWVATRSFVPHVSFGLQRQSDNGWFFSMAPLYGSSAHKATFGARNFNGFKWFSSMMVLHGRRSGSKTYFYVGNLGAGALRVSDGTSNYYEFFNDPWPGKLRISLGSPGHKHTSVTIQDVRLYRDGATGFSPDDYAGVNTNTWPFLLNNHIRINDRPNSPAFIPDRSQGPSNVFLIYWTAAPCVSLHSTVRTIRFIRVRATVLAATMRRRWTSAFAMTAS